MSEPRTRTLSAPGAALYYDIREAETKTTAPVLLMIGHPMDARGFTTLAGHFRDRTIELVESKRDGDGRWPLDRQHPGTMAVEVNEGEGQPSRWNTLRALRVLEWYSARG